MRRVGSASLAVIGLALLAYGGYHLLQAKASESWPDTTGTILTTSVKKHRGRVRPGWQETEWSSFHVEYTYSVGGREHTGTRVHYGGGESWGGLLFGSRARKLAREYTKGRRVRVYYKRSDPSQALLRPGLTWELFIIPGIGLACLLCAGIAHLAPEHASSDPQGESL